MEKKLQVFVSSTFSDLQTERQAAVAAILRAGHIPAGMELFTAGDQSQWDVIRRWIDDSDVYMLILGGRYGTVEEASGKSYTELEYDYALSIGKPVFAVVMADGVLDARVREHGLQISEQSRPAELAAFRAKVLTKISVFYSDVRDIKTCVYESLQDFSRNRDLVGWVPSDKAEDTRPLREEVMRLSVENERLKSELAKNTVVTSSRPQEPTEVPEFEALRNLFRSESADVSEKESSSGAPGSMSIYDAITNNRIAIIKGTVVGRDSDEPSKWFEKNVLIRMVIHKLMESQRTAAGNQRYNATGKGLDFLAWIDRQGQ